MADTEVFDNFVFGNFEGHEQVVFGADASTGLKAIVAIHSTALGAALGGTRCYPYASEQHALLDVLNLSRAMSYKNALAGLDHGGGKAVIIADPQTQKTPELLRAYGRFIDSLAGRYITACDVGTYVADMDVVASQTRFVTGRSAEHGGSGDSSVLTAHGVFQGMRACAQFLWGLPTLQGRSVAISGVGKVGHRLVQHVLADGGQVVIHDVNPAAVEAVMQRHPEVEVAASAEELVAWPADMLSPNALGGALNDDSLPRIRAAAICGGANNQLASAEIANGLSARGICYAPDYVVNSGGVIQVADELQGFSFKRAQSRATKIFQTTLEVLQSAQILGVPPVVAADRLAEERIAAAPSSASGASE